MSLCRCRRPILRSIASASNRICVTPSTGALSHARLNQTELSSIIGERRKKKMFRIHRNRPMRLGEVKLYQKKLQRFIDLSKGAERMGQAVCVHYVCGNWEDDC
ncbi:uncharacterized protein LOC133712761 [Rosa rugosa]|uniref:uncharacterized protein LOC133712761 n=1 Tax=Rosa rugosa TaxID=74645 RepID=UPI002B4153A1|nr:uncharacterized protein LOC133712761 [Rosa rugosa]